MFRLAWPAQYLQEAGHDSVRVRYPDERWEIGAGLDKHNNVVDVVVPDDARAIILQRTTHAHLVDCIPFWQEKGIKVIIDVDDDLTCIHPSNPAYAGLRPGNPSMHLWSNLTRACVMADVVTCSTPALAERYPGNTIVLENYLPDTYYGLDHTDSSEIAWPASIGSHPDDPDATSGALNRLHADGTTFRTLGSDDLAVQRAFSLSRPAMMDAFVDIADWPAYLAGIGIGIAPLAATKFNAAKSWLKVLEMSACGVPWIASDRVEYRRFHDRTGVGTIVKDRGRDWYRAIDRLVNDEVARKEASEAGRAIAEAFRLRDHVVRWALTWGL